MKQILTCTHCHHRGEDVIVRTVYVGGKGLVHSIECQDRVACWDRWKEHIRTIVKEVVHGTP